jgi:V/A-type H+-transporting ATPase subunit B
MRELKTNLLDIIYISHMIDYKTIQAVEGPLLFIERTEHIGYQEIVTMRDAAGKELQGQVIALDGNTAVIQSFQDPAGFQLSGSRARFVGKPKTMNLSPSLLGRIFNGQGVPLDEKVQIDGKERDINTPVYSQPLPYDNRNVNGAAINPYRRAEPHSFIQTGISTIDLTTTIVKGQKIPIFSGNGLPDLEILTQIASNVRTNDPEEAFVVVVAGMGITYEQYSYLRSHLEQSGAISRTVMYVNLASDPVIERILTPRLALTVAEYLAFELDFSVLALLFDLTNYANAMREVSTAKKEIPGRSGYPGYLYTDLATILERAGTIEGKKGSITQVPILTMPNDDKTHVVPDLTGYITEGQIVLDRSMHRQGIYPAVNILPSLSRLKNKGQDSTREDHSAVADQIFASLAEAIRQEELALVLGKDSLSDVGKKYLAFKDAYMEEFAHQGMSYRTIEETLTIAWNILSLLPREELKKIKDDMYEKYAVKRA